MQVSALSKTLLFRKFYLSAKDRSVWKLFVLDRDTWYQIIMPTNNDRQIRKSAFYKMQWNIENIVIIIIKHLQINQILVLHNP